jgi:hypothetical protein
MVRFVLVVDLVGIVDQWSGCGYRIVFVTRVQCLVTDRGSMLTMKQINEFFKKT